MGEGYFSIEKETGTEIINLNGKKSLSIDGYISSFSKGYAVVNFGEYYIDSDGNEVVLEIE